jgi:hypothetical protein
VLAIISTWMVVATAHAAPPPQQPVGSAPPSTVSTPPSAVAPGGQPAPSLPTTGVLSDEQTVSAWAHPVEEAGIHARPLVASRRIARTHLETEDGFPEVYLVLTISTDARGLAWAQVRIPGRPNGRVGWLPRSALGELHVTHWLIEISLRRRRLRAYFQGKLRFTAPVGVGKSSTPTPVGHFWIRERFKIANRNNPFWPYALGTSAYSTLTEWPGGGVVGIHGDLGEPQLIPGNPSHGCVRMRDRDIAWLALHVQIGTPVRIVR